MVAPGRHVEFVTDTLAVQDLGHLYVAAFAEVVFRCAQDNVHPVKLVVLRARHEVGRVIEIDVVVVVAAQEGTDIESRAHGQQVTDLLGVPESKVEGVVPAERCATYAYFLNVTFTLNTGNQLFVQKFVVEDMVPDPGTGVQVLGIQTVFIDTANTVQFYFSRFYKPAGGLGKTEIPVFIVLSHRRWKQHDRVAPVSVNQHLDVSPEVVRIPGSVVFLHGKELMRTRLN